MERTTDFDYDDKEMNHFIAPKVSRCESDEFDFEPSLFRYMPSWAPSLGDFYLL